MKVLWPGWFYGPNGEAQIFQCQEEVPDGWFDSPQKAVANCAVIARELRGNSAEGQTIEIIEAKKANNSAEEFSASPPKAKRPYRRKAK